MPIDHLAPGQHVLLLASIDVIVDGPLVAARNELHGPGVEACVGECQPRSDHVVRLEPPVGRVLVIADELVLVRLFDEPVERPAENVHSQHIFHRVDDSRIVNEIPGPALDQVKIGAQPKRT